MTPEEIKKLKAKHGDTLSLCTVTTQNGDAFEFILKKPSRATIQAVSSVGDNTTKASDLMIENCVVGGNLEALEDGEVFIAVLEEVGNLFGAATSTVKKL